jgi:hypothetical protein
VWDTRTDQLLTTLPHASAIRARAPLAIDAVTGTVFVGDRANSIRSVLPMHVRVREGRGYDLTGGRE